MTSGLRGARSCQSEDVVSEHTELDWQVVSLTDVSESVRYGYTASASTDEIGPKFLRITDIVPQCISWHSVPYCEGNERDLEKYLLQVGDIVVARTGATVGYAKQIRTPENAVFASYLVKFRINSEIAEPRFIGHLVESNVYKQYVKSQVGGAAQPNANAKVLGRFSFTLPPRRVQRRIADILSAYDDLIENNRRRIALLEQAARELYREWFVRLRFPGYENTRIIDGVPDGWEKVSFAQLAEFVNGYAFKPAQLGNVGLPIIKIPELKSGITAKTPRNPGDLIPTKYHIHDGDLLFSWSGTLAVNVWTSGDALLNQHLFVVKPTDRVSRALLMFALREARASFDNQTVGATMRHIRRSALDTVTLCLPAYPLLKAFECALSGVLELIIFLSKQNIRLTEARDLLLPRLMSGKVAV